MHSDPRNKITGIFGDGIDGHTLNQFYNAIREPFVEKAALMSDAHFGYALPIGAVAATRDYVVPSWVGYDIGCGMLAMPTTFDANDLEVAGERVMDAIYTKVPVGRATHGEAFQNLYKTKGMTEEGYKVFVKRGGPHHLGSLGSGNHFIELGADETGTVWIVIHSGSRGPGHGIATYYMNLAAGDGQHPEGNAAFAVDSDEGQRYLQDVGAMTEFAFHNRYVMAWLVETALRSVGLVGEFDQSKRINRSHNHVEYDNHSGLWIHRKGATHAEDGMPGVIPGSMHHGSYIVRGKGSTASLQSSSHGAGRAMSRRQAKRTIPLDDFVAQMEGIHARVNESTLDEAPPAYKDPEAVMAAQTDLVDVIHRVKPIINIKG